MRIPYPNELYHHGVKGQKWGVRRYQYKDGRLTTVGKKRYNKKRDSDFRKAINDPDDPIGESLNIVQKKIHSNEKVKKAFDNPVAALIDAVSDVKVNKIKKEQELRKKKMEMDIQETKMLMDYYDTKSKNETKLLEMEMEYHKF